MTQHVKRILQIIPAAGWRMVTPFEGKTWGVDEEPIACFALCEMEQVDADGLPEHTDAADATWQAILPCLRGDGLIEPWADDAVEATDAKLIGPGFVGRVSAGGYVSSERERPE